MGIESTLRCYLSAVFRDEAHLDGSNFEGEVEHGGSGGHFEIQLGPETVGNC